MVSKASITVFLKSFCLEGLIFARLCPFFYYILYVSRFIDYCYVNVRRFPISEYLCKHCKEIFVIIGFGKHLLTYLYVQNIFSEFETSQGIEIVPNSF